jgi:hypothetical protein
MESRYTVSTRLALSVLAIIVGAQIYRSATLPIGSEEAYLYDRFVRPTIRQALSAELPDRDVLYVLLEKRSVGLFHVSPLAVRLPNILFGILFLWSIWKIGHALLRESPMALRATEGDEKLGRHPGLSAPPTELRPPGSWFSGEPWWFSVSLVVTGAIPLYFGWFNRATGTGVAIALLVCAIAVAIHAEDLKFSGVLLGLSICAGTAFAIPAAAVAVSILAIQRRWWMWCNQVLIPAVVVAWALLVLPLTHAHAAPQDAPELTTDQAVHLQEALDTLRASAGKNHIRIGALPAAEPVVNFYRAQHRATTWERASRDYSSGEFDYYLLSASDSGWADQQHLIVLHPDADFLLARRPPAAM